MALVLRSVKGSKLNIAEMDGNLLYLVSTLSASLIQVTGSSFSAPNTSITGAYFKGNGSALTNVGAAGSNNYIQYNNNGILGAEAAFTYNSASNTLTVSNIVATDIQVGKGIDTNNGYLLDSGDLTSVDWKNRTLKYTGGTISVDWATNDRLILSGSQIAIKGLTNTLQANLLAINPSTGLIYYMPTSSVSPITASLLATASVNSNVITFTKGNGSTFNITIDTGSTSPASPTNAIQFNNSGVWGGDSSFTFDGTNYNFINGNGSSIPYGTYSHAEGYQTSTENDYSHAEGYQTIAYGLASHTEGYQTTASGDYAHAEGYYTLAASTGTHTEGLLTTASQFYAHAEGELTKAKGYASHAEGWQTTAVTSYSHAEGKETAASGVYSHAEGDLTKAIGLSSHAEGRYTTASGDWSHAEGVRTNATGAYSHAEGVRTLALGSTSHAEGYYTFASGNFSHTEGNNTTASGQYSHAEGYKTLTIGDYSHAEGRETITSGSYSYAAGYGSITSGSYQFVVGQYNIPNPSSSVFIIGDGDDTNNRHNVLFISKSYFELNASKVYLNGLSNTPQDNVVVVNSTTGELSYIPTSSLQPDYYVYSAVLSQTGTSAPTAVVLKNTFPGSIVWSRQGTGWYRATLTGAFTYQRTMAFSSIPETGLCSKHSFLLNNINYVQFFTYDQFGSRNDGLMNATTPVEIRVYP